MIIESPARNRPDGEVVSTTLDVRIASGFASLEALRPHWDEFLARCSIEHPFVSFDWLLNWYTAFAPTEDACLTSVWRAGELVCVLPLMRSRTRMDGIAVSQLMPWVNTHSFRSELLFNPVTADGLTEAVETLRTLPSWDVAFLPFVPAHGERIRKFTRSLEDAGYSVLREPGMVSPRLKIDGDWDSFMAGLSSSRRQSERRKARKLLEKRSGRVEISVGNVSDLAERLRDCWKVSANTWKHANGSSIASCEKRIAFYSSIGACESNWLVLAILYLDDKPIAFEYNLLYGKILFNLKLGYDEGYRELSPGQVLRFKMLEWAFDNSVKEFDFMGNEADYKNTFSNDALPHENIRVFSNSAKGKLISLLELGIRPIVRSVKSRLCKMWN